MRLLSCIYLSVSECAYRISLIVAAAAAAAAATKKNMVQGMRECSRMNAGDALM